MRLNIKRLAYYAVAGLVFVGLQPAGAEQVYFYQSPARISIDQIKTVNDTNMAVLQPSKSDTNANRYFHELTVNVYINGDTTSLDYVAACLYSPNLSVSVDSACGYDTSTSAADTSYPDSNPDEVVSFRWEGDNAGSVSTSDWILDGEGSVDHFLDSDSSSITVTTDDTTQLDDSNTNLTMTKVATTFRFALSHATLNETGWQVRVSVASTSDGPDTAGSETTGDNIQFRSELTDTQTYGVYFYGAFRTDTGFRPSVDYGSLQQNSSKIQSSIVSGQYWSNDSVDFAIAGGDFVYNGDTIPLIEDPKDTITGMKAARLTCTSDSSGLTTDFSANDADDPAVYDSEAVVVRSQIDLSADTGLVDAQDILLASQPASGEDPATAAEHRCKLEYGVGATFADNVYTNTVTLGMLDANTADGLTAGLFGIDTDGTRNIPTILQPPS